MWRTRLRQSYHFRACRKTALICAAIVPAVRISTHSLAVEGERDGVARNTEPARVRGSTTTWHSAQTSIIWLRHETPGELLIEQLTDLDRQKWSKFNWLRTLKNYWRDT